MDILPLKMTLSNVSSLLWVLIPSSVERGAETNLALNFVSLLNIMKPMSTIMNIKERKIFSNKNSKY